MDNAAGWNISGNHLYNDKADGIMASRLYGTTISGNFIEDFASQRTAGHWYGIAGTVQGGNGSTIYGNRIFNDLGETAMPRTSTLASRRSTAGTGNALSYGNAIGRGHPDRCRPFFNSGAGSLAVAVAGNVITRVGTHAAAFWCRSDFVPRELTARLTLVTNRRLARPGGPVAARARAVPHHPVAAAPAAIPRMCRAVPLQQFIGGLVEPG